MTSRWADIPFAPRKVPVFYGWVIMVLGAVGTLMSMPGQTAGVSAFTESLIAALGLSRVQLATAYLIGTGASALLLTPAGRLYDKLGARAMAPMVAAALAGVLVGLSRCDHISRFFGQLLGGPDGSTFWAPFLTITTGYFLIRFLGQGVLTMICRNMTMKWFDRHRGLVNGIAGVGVALGFSAAPRLFAAMVEEIGWRGTWMWLAGALGIVFAAVALLTFRDNPEQCGLVPDGGAASEDPDKPSRRPVVHRQFTLGQAVRSYAFWPVALTCGLGALYFTGLTFHVEDIHSRVGLGEVAFDMFLPASIIGVTLNLLVGWLSDHIRLRWPVLAMAVGVALSSLAFAHFEPGLWRWVLIGGYGLATGMFGVLMAVTWPRFFGREHLGAISGLALAIVVAGSAIGPWVFSLSLAHTGSYEGAGWACLAVAGALGLAALAVRNPQNAR